MNRRACLLAAFLAVAVNLASGGDAVSAPLGVAAPTVISCDAMTAKQFLITSGGVVYGFLLATAVPENLTRENKIWLWLAFTTYWIAFGLYEARQRRWRYAMTLPFIVITGAVLGAVAGLLIGAFFREPTKAKTSDPTALVLSISAGPTMVTMAPLIPDPNQKPAGPDDLEFYFFALLGAASGDNIQYADVTITNRSQRKMHLEMWGIVDYWKDSGEPARYGLKAEWTPEDMKEGTGQKFIDLEPWETKKGRVAVFLGKPEGQGLSRWFLDPGNVYFDVFDSVTGKRIAFKGMDGYPSGQMPSPLPSHKELLKLDFPEVAANAAQTGTLPEPLGLLLRTRDKRHSGTKFMVDALCKNLSPEPMELEVSLLIRNLAVENTWVLSEGLFGDSGAKDSPGVRTLGIEPGDTVVRNLIFDLAALGVPSTGGWNLRDQPKDTLLEISDRKSGKKAWCALRPGYPPGTDMRSANVLENPQANSNNPAVDEPNQSK